MNCKILFFVFTGFCFSSLFSQTESKNPEATSLFGKPLYKIELTTERKKEFESKLNSALEEYYLDSTNVDKFIWVGRHIAYLGDYLKSIEWYTNGLKKFPDNYKILRHRGHRYISIREFEKAKTDLEKSAKLISKIPDEVEPDGMPNKFNIPTSTTHSNIWYHLGLVYYLQKNYRESEIAFNECLKFSKNNDMLCATLDWLYMVKRKLNKKIEADELLHQISPEMTILENHAYFNRLLMYKGLKKPEELLSDSTTDAVIIATQGFGVGNWYLLNAQKKRANEIFLQVLNTSNWSAFGFIASEVEIAK